MVTFADMCPTLCLTTYSWIKGSGEVLEVSEHRPQLNIRVSDVEEDTDDGLSRTGVVDHLCVCVWGGGVWVCSGTSVTQTLLITCLAK